MVRLGQLGEREIVAKILSSLRPPPGLGPGDDAAAIDLCDRWLVVSSDLLGFTTHRPPGTSWERMGWMAAAVNFSDIASMGAEPIGFIASLALSSEMELSDLMEMVSGMDQCAEFCGTHLIGGDTKQGPGFISGTALGLVPKGEMLTRSGAKVGDLVAVTGSLGGAAAGWYSIEAGLEMPDARDRLTLVIPRVKEGRALAATGAVSCCMDISDGLAVSIHEICRLSGVGTEIVWESIPVFEDVPEVAEKTGVPVREMVLHYGGDYELLFTFPHDKLDVVRDSSVDFYIIGRVVAGGDKILIAESQIEKIEDRGYEHFRN